MKTNKPPIFIVGSGRCGTVSLCEMLKHETTYSVHEPSPGLAEDGFNYFQGDINYQQAKELVIQKRQKIIKEKQEQGLQYIETAHFLTMFIEILAEIYPKAKFIWLYRPIEEFVKSGMNRKWYCKDDLPQYKAHRWFPKGTKKFSDEYTREDKLRWLHKQYNNQAFEQFRNISNKVFRLETIQLNDINTLKKLKKFVGFPKKIEPQWLKKH